MTKEENLTEILKEMNLCKLEVEEFKTKCFDAELACDNAFHTSALSNLTLNDFAKQDDVYQKEIKTDVEFYKCKLALAEKVLKYNTLHTQARELKQKLEGNLEPIQEIKPERDKFGNPIIY